MAGHQRRRADPVGEGDHRVDAELAVAEHAWVRGAPLCVSAQERTDHAGPELRLEVEGEMRDPERVGHLARAQNRLGGATAPLPVGALVRPQLHGHGNHVRPPLALEQRGDRTVHPAAERDKDSLALGRRRGEGRPDPPVPRSPCGARRLRALPRGGGSERAPELLSTWSGPIRAASRIGAPSAISAIAAAAAEVAAQPSASKLTRSIRPSGAAIDSRTRSPHGAPPAEPLWEPSGAGPRLESSLR
jgi:hypothetical protein